MTNKSLHIGQGAPFDSRIRLQEGRGGGGGRRGRREEGGGGRRGRGEEGEGGGGGGGRGDTSHPWSQNTHQQLALGYNVLYDGTCV